VDMQDSEATCDVGQSSSKVGNKLSVTLVTGLQSSGKSSLLKHTFANRDGLRVRALVNKLFSESSIDTDLNVFSGAPGMDSEVMLRDGCICCSGRVDLLVELMQLAKQGGLDHLIIEASSMALPLPIAELFRSAPKSHEGVKRRHAKELNEFADLDTVVCVVDGTCILEQLQGSRCIPKEDSAARLVDAVEFADIIVLNKCDLISDTQAIEAQHLLKVLNPEAGVFPVAHGMVPTYEILGRGKYMWEELGVKQPTRKWLEQAHQMSQSASLRTLFSSSCSCCEAPSAANTLQEQTQFGITQFVYRRARPFHPKRLAEVINTGLPFPLAALRMKGTAWICSQLLHSAAWSSVGTQIDIKIGRPWWATIPSTQWPVETLQQLKDAQVVTSQGEWVDSNCMDRKTQIQVISKDLEVAEIERCLDKLLLTEAEFSSGASTWVSFQDELLPVWSFPVSGDVLCLCVKSGQENILQALCMQKADVNARSTCDGKCALHVAAAEDRASAARSLLTWRADVNSAAEASLTPLHFASSREMVDLLLENAANPSLVDSKGCTPLHFATSCGRLEATATLLACRAHVDPLVYSSETHLRLVEMTNHEHSSSIDRFIGC